MVIRRLQIGWNKKEHEGAIARHSAAVSTKMAIPKGSASKPFQKASKSFSTLENLPKKILSSIVEMAVCDPVDICPFYDSGYMPDPTLFSDKELAVIGEYGLYPIWHKKRQNIDIPLTKVNRNLGSLALESFYTNSVFLFNDARSFFWFVKRLGDVKFCKVKNAVFNFSSGFFLSREYRSSSDVCEEQKWAEVFLMLRSKHGLRNCVFRFYEFNGLEARKDLSESEKVCMTQARLDLIAILCRFRGMKNVRFENDRCEFLGRAAGQQMAKIMTQSEEEWPVMSFAMETSEFDKYIAVDKVSTADSSTQQRECFFPGVGALFSAKEFQIVDSQLEK